MDIRNVPNEILESVFAHLNHKEIIQCRLVCRLFNEVITASIELQYKIECESEGMVDVEQYRLSPAERLKSLREQRLNWDNLRWLEQGSVEISGSCQAYELVGGIFARLTNFQDFFSVSLPSVKTEGQVVHRSDIGFRARDFAMDPTQDLIIFLEDRSLALPSMQLQIRTFSTHQPHPEATSPVIPISGRFDSGALQIAGDLVAVFYIGLSTYLHIWNWKANKLVVDMRFTSIRPVDFTFLSENAYVLTFPADHGHLAVYSVSSPDQRARLFLPVLCADVNQELERLAIHTSPFFASPLPGRPFTTSETNRIHVLSMEYAGFYQSTFELRAFIPNDVLLSYVSSYHDQTQHIPWEDWGPKNTRVLEALQSHSWLRFVSGSRVVMPVARFKWDLQVLNFQTMRKLDEPLDTATATHIKEPTVIRRPTFFKDDIVTHLPYSLCTRQIPPALQIPYISFMIGEDHLLGLRLGMQIDAGITIHTLAL
ncbi:hypothetical protein BDN72DRAFT_827503 [Pluteus cervinus]|uniref:Uncharacterized protein n=1 Tax=Pluteus cervinus TaxID=181527 RepID=A0ACD3A9J0_9AGAR|nr:hypothetical protein BDN72DRAFT_827503 [Pluteus cervinus]